jgi:glyoxylase-like metal-dependent hydrolase (beta-lactamase superfamily II)
VSIPSHDPIMSDVIQIPLPLLYLGSVNVWLLRGDPLTLVDTGPATDEALESLEEQLGEHGFAVEDIESVLITHHHLDHSGLATAIKQRSGADIAAHRGTALWGLRIQERAAAERQFTLALMASHGVPEHVVEGSQKFFDRILADSAPYETDRVLSEGDTVRAGSRTLRVVFRPGHSTTDTLFVDESSYDAFVGDHLLANITSGAELMPTELPGDERRRGLLDYLANLRKTQAMGLRTCYSGHGPTIENHRALIDDRLAFHSTRLDRIADYVADGCPTAFEIAQRLWSEDVAATQPVLVIWEVLGHLDVLVNRGTVREEVDEHGMHRFCPREAVRLAVANG